MAQHGVGIRWPLSDLRHGRARTLPLVDMTWEDAVKVLVRFKE